MRRTWKRLGGAAMATLLVLSACTVGSASTKPPMAAKGWSAFRDDFLAGYFALNPTFAVYQGRHEFDGRLPDWSAAGLARQISFLEGVIEQAKAFKGPLDTRERFERDYLVHVAKGQLFFLRDAEFPRRNPAYYSEALDPNVYIARPYADAETRMKAFIAYAETIPSAAQQIEANLVLPLPATFVKYGEASFSGFADYYTGDAKAAFSAVRDEALQRRFDAAAANAASAMRKLAAHIASSPATEGGFALGAEKFAAMIEANEAVDTPLAELEAIGLADLRRNQASLKAACARFAQGRSLGACMKKMGANKAADGPVAEARRQLPMLRAFLLEKDLVTIAGSEEARVEESPPYNRQNSAYIDIPGPYETGLPSIYYISPPDPAWDEQAQLDFVPGKMDLLFTSVHEIWPGHFLNLLHSNRATSDFGKLFVGYAFAEGWAHYAEEMMWDAGLGDGDPETHVGQLSNALLRNCRYLSAIGLHTRGMSVGESERMFREECYQDEGNARQQAARGTYDPLYLNYTLGKLMIARLRDDWTKGERSRWKAFHDAFLSYGGPPIPLVRSAMMKEAAPRAVF